MTATGHYSSRRATAGSIVVTAGAGKDGSAIELKRRIEQMSDEELKAQAVALIAKL